MVHTGAAGGLQSGTMPMTQLHRGGEIGAFIHAKRVGLDLSKSEAASRAGVSRRTWHEIEEGQRPGPSARTLAQLDEVLGLAPGTLFAMSTKGASFEIEQLRQRAAALISTLGLVELQTLVEQAEDVAAGDFRSDIAKLRDDLDALHKDVTALIEAKSDGRGRGSGRSRRPRSTTTNRDGTDDSAAHADAS